MANQAMTAAYKTTKSSIQKKSLHTPFSGPNGVPEMVGLLGRATFEQAAAATLAAQSKIAMHDGKVRKLLIACDSAPGAGENMIYDVQVNEESILSATPQLTAADTTAGVYDVISLVLPGTSIKVGDLITVSRTYTEGAGDVELNTVVLEWG